MLRASFCPIPFHFLRMPDANRTRNPQLRRLVLYPVELRAQLMDKPAQKQHNFVLSFKYTQELNAKQDGFDSAGMSMLSHFNCFAYCLMPIAFYLMPFSDCECDGFFVYLFI